MLALAANLCYNQVAAEMKGANFRAKGYLYNY